MTTKMTDIGTADTYHPADIMGDMYAAIDRALDAGYDPRLDPEEPAYVTEARNAHNALKKALEEAGKVAVWWADGWLRFEHAGRQTCYRGAAVENCDYRDSFVRHLARQFRDGDY